MMNDLESSFDGSNSMDLTSVLNNNPDGDVNVQVQKQLLTMFDTCMKTEENMKVYLRVRPIDKKSESTIVVDSERTIITTAPESSKRAQYTKMESRYYAFTKVFGPNAQQDEVFNNIAGPLLTRFLSGENCALFAYGMTNSGKTYTTQGSAQSPGILPRLVGAILEQMHEHPGSELNMSMLEIYQDYIYDLLSKKKEKLSIRDANQRVEVAKLSSHPVTSSDGALRLMDAAAAKRSKSSTFLNTGSSRSHAVYTITLNRTVAGREATSVAFHIIDLAGAERGNRTKATAAQQKEANNINTSLMQLWRCLQGIKNNKSRDLSSSMEVIPFRESKLTHLLMPILSRAGMSGIGMVACVNPQVDDYDETLSVLGNASLAVQIKEIADVGRLASSQLEQNTSGKSNSTIAAQSGAAVPLKSSGVDKRPTNVVRETAKSRQQKNKGNLVALERNGKRKVSELSNARDSVITETRSSSLETALMEKMVQPSSLAFESDEDQHIRSLLNRIQSLEDELESQPSESQIREEVFEEMTARSQGLLDEISSLNARLAQYEDLNQPMDVTKSVKKARRQQLDVAQEGMALDLREAEEELERHKVRFEKELAAMRETNRVLSERNFVLEKENAALKSAAVVSSARQPAIIVQKPTMTKSNSENIPLQSISDEFSQRMQRHKKSEDSVVVKPMFAADEVCYSKKSPNRAPLSPLNGNSPSPHQRSISPLKHNVSAVISAINSKSAINVKVVDSPQRLRGNLQQNENAAPTGPYQTRLRANHVR